MQNQDEFTYEGYLVFNRIFDLHPDFQDENLIDYLPTYDPEAPGDGFENVGLYDYYSEGNHKVDVDDSWISEIGSYRFLYDNLNETEAYVDDELRTVHVPERKTADIYVSSGRLFIRGNSNDSKKAENRLQEYLSPEQLNPSKFEPDFLLWILYQYFVEFEFDDLDIKQLTDAKVSGSKDRFGEFNSISGSTDLLHSSPISAGILTDKDLEMIGGYFLVNGHTVRANISSDRIHIKVTNEMNDLSDLDRVVLSIKFVDEICTLHSDWHDLPTEEKYPPASFFEYLRDTLENEGFALNYPVQQTIEEYADRRGGETR